MTFKEIYDKCMPLEKRKKERMNFWVAWVVRPLSVLFTAPFVNTRIRPSDITILSIVFSIIGFCLISYPCDNMLYKLIGWFCFFIWAILDGVDGNLARCQGTCSPMGELWDAVGGYASMVLIFMAAGFAAFYDNNILTFCPSHILLAMCGFSALASIFPRLILHKKNNIIPEEKSSKKLNDKSSFGLKEIIAMNFISVSGFMQVIFLAAILTHTLNIFTLVYLVINVAIMIVSLRSMLK